MSSSECQTFSVFFFFVCFFSRLFQVFLLMLALISVEKTVGETNEHCFEKCPAGHYKVGTCTGQLVKCEICGEGSYTAVPSTIDHCQRCESCGSHEKRIKPCNRTSNTQCECKEGYYNAGDDDNRSCQSCRSCKRDSKCRSKCASPTTPLPSTSTSASTTKQATETATPALSPDPLTTSPTRTTASRNTSTPVKVPITYNHQMFWIMVVLITLLMLFWFLLILGSLHRYLYCSPCWNTNKDIGSPDGEANFNEPNHQGSPTTLTLNIAEETPMMALSSNQAVQESPTHISPLLRNGDHSVATRNEQSDRWPAVVLYAIIKEVPLRRWKEFLRLLSVADQELERVELEAGLGLGSIERQYQMLRLWSQRSSASMNDVFSALHYMDLSGCAQLLQESLEKMQWRPGPKQGFTACRSHTDHSWNGAAQDT
ncbi:tumor necrosis factor receptor superfamily member 1A isoform X2 [Mugil cephalus]|uniref:tumor necrosis factor receptor superfamily member 1A isoform X2 n=1 Tax=Mugil cephalus TaxID=48193 RepID=UPI001FB8512D|nr:tumor necrosis factor receptor superfamily member 1A isoform X2 [Mugil cephalus]